MTRKKKTKGGEVWICFFKGFVGSNHLVDADVVASTDVVVVVVVFEAGLDDDDEEDDEVGSLY